MKGKLMPDVAITEVVLSEARIDKAGSVIKGVKLLNQVSRNGRIYSREAMMEAARLYEGLPVNVDHPKGGSAGATATREFKDRIGRITNVKFLGEGQGVVGDLTYNPSHPWASTLEWWAENDPAGVAMSHNSHGRGRMRDGKFLVEGFVKIRSVDLVADGGTTKGLYEHYQEEDTAAQRTSDDSLAILLSETLKDTEFSDEDKDTTLTSLIEEWRKGRIPTPKPTLEENEMELKDLTLDQIKTERKDLYESIVSEIATGEEAKKKDATIKALTEELDASKAVTAAAARKTAITTALQESKLPKEALSDLFVTNLMEAADDAAIKELIEDRKSVWLSSTKPRSKGKDLLEGSGNANVTVEDFVSAIGN